MRRSSDRLQQVTPRGEVCASTVLLGALAANDSEPGGVICSDPEGHNLLMVEPIKPYPVRQIAMGQWQVLSDLPFRGARDDRWWCIGHMVREDRCPTLTLLSRGDDRELLVW